MNSVSPWMCMYRYSNGWRLPIGLAGVRADRLAGNVQHYAGQMQRAVEGAAG